MTSESDLGGAVALVSGAGQGIGLEVALLLSKRGAQVAALDCDSEALCSLCARAQELGFNVVPYACDVSDAERVNEVIEQVVDQLGPPVLLANVAGIMKPGEAASIREDDWSRTFAVNTTGVMHLCRGVAGHMKRMRQGAIVTVASNAARVARVQFAAYAASKAAAVAYTKCLGLELAPHKIRCNVVSPGSTDTPMLRALAGTPDFVDTMIEGVPGQFRIGIPLGTIASPRAVAEAVVFLLSDEAQHITLADICVDGGASLGA